MEIEGATFLFTLAALMITFGGFSAVLLGIRQAAGGRSSSIDRYLFKTLLTQILVLTAGSLLPLLLALYGISETWVWRGSALLFAMPMLGLLLTYPYRRLKAVGKGPPPIVFAIVVVLGSAAILAMLASIFGGFGHQPAVYITALLINFLTTAFAFIRALDVIMQEPA